MTNYHHNVEIFSLIVSFSGIYTFMAKCGKINEESKVADTPKSKDS
jgi:hypothetical protein